MANREDVARLAGVSGATVSRFFNNPSMLSPLIAEKVHKAASELNYYPNIIASNFVKGISGNIGVIIPKIPNVHIFSVYYFSELLSGIGEALGENGYDLMLFFHSIHVGEENDYSSYFKSSKVDGCILLGTRRNDAGLVRLMESGYKFCLVNNYIEGLGINFVDADNVTGSFNAVDYLIKLGHKRIAFLNGPMHFSNSLDRLKGYKQALASSKIRFTPDLLLQGNYGRKSGYMASADIMNMNPRPTAVFAGNDRMAAGIMQGLKEKGVRVPEDIAVIGYDDSDTASVVDPQLTTVRVPFFELGKRCASEFANTLSGERKESFGIFVDTNLIIRASSGEPI